MRFRLDFGSDHQKAPGGTPGLRVSQKRQTMTLFSYGIDVTNATVMQRF
ncbi:MAG: hypothetical protein AB8E87_14220 [Prochlorococcus sp.]|nr:hypothetical protein [Prochlorococcaceae cyanobacterium Fu_MAG_50]